MHPPAPTPAVVPVARTALAQGDRFRLSPELSTHVLAGVITEADTPTAAVEALAARVDVLRTEILNRKASEFTASHHATLVAGEEAQGRA